jgi:hypothetical protein
MNPIISLLKKLNINETDIKALFTTLTENPMNAMVEIQKLGVPTEQLQTLMMMVMTTPALIKEAVEELGLDVSVFKKAQEKMNNHNNE